MLQAAANETIARTALREPYFAVKIRRGDKLDRGFNECTVGPPRLVGFFE